MVLTSRRLRSPWLWLAGCHTHPNQTCISVQPTPVSWQWVASATFRLCNADVKRDTWSLLIFPLGGSNTEVQNKNNCFSDWIFLAETSLILDCWGHEAQVHISKKISAPLKKKNESMKIKSFATLLFLLKRSLFLLFRDSSTMHYQTRHGWSG